MPGELEGERWSLRVLGKKRGKPMPGGGSECLWKMGSVCELGTVPPERDSV
jgi:hypothetical protein